MLVLPIGGNSRVTPDEPIGVCSQNRRTPSATCGRMYLSTNPRQPSCGVIYSVQRTALFEPEPIPNQLMSLSYFEFMPVLGDPGAAVLLP